MMKMVSGLLDTNKDGSVYQTILEAPHAVILSAAKNLRFQ